MATNVGTIVVELVTSLSGFKSGMDKASKEIQGFSQRTGQWVKDSKIAITAAIGAVTTAIVTSLKAYAEQEKAVATLTNALRNQGIESLKVRDDILAQADAFANLSTYADENIIAAQAVLVQYGLTGDVLKETTRIAMDFASATGRDLTDAANALGKASKGTTTEFSRMGIEFKKGATDTEKFIGVLETLDGRFQGQALTMRNTVGGGFQVMMNAVNELQETVGQFLSSDAVGFTNFFTNLVLDLKNGIAQILEMSKAVGGFGEFLKQNLILALAAVGQALIDIFAMIPGMQNAMKWWGVNLDQTKTQLGEMAIEAQNAANQNMAWTTLFGINEQAKQQSVKKTSEVTTAAHKLGLDQNAKALLDKQQKAEANLLLQTQQAKQLADMDKLVTEEALKRASEANEKEKKLWSDRAEFIISQVNRYTDMFAQGIADMALEGRKFSDIIKKMWEDLARQVIAAIVRMIIKWLAFLALRGVMTAFGGGFGAGMATAIQTALQSSGRMAEGGIIGEPSLITGLKSGSQIVAGETGPEAVVPMTGKNVAAGPGGLRLASSGVGDVGITINISGQFIEGNEVGWQKLIRDKIVPEIRRFTMGTPTGPFNRRRGVTV